MQKQSHPTGLLAGGAFAPCERFAAGKTSAQAEFTSAEHFNPKGESRLWRLKPKKKGLPIGSPFFLVREAGVEPARPCEHWHLKPASLPIPPLAHVD